MDSLQALRNVAALLVLFFHYRFYLRDNDEIGTSVWDIILGKGIIGVDVFFVALLNKSEICDDFLPIRAIVT
ncbi:hypothetical protein [Candidatus Sodalis pierantonius]|uniref:hypothetical protein n=1 Tax=Candidatus Sodalis pierantonii TaxID=1486991 RepID=UPI0011DDF7F3|nr:hypothetical protein [Candidatus Sodalis pierantonius]